MTLLTKKERAKLRAIRDAACDLIDAAIDAGFPSSNPADLEAAWQRLLALRWQGMDSAPRDGTDLLGYEASGNPDIRGDYYHMAWIGQSHDDGYWISRCGQHVTRSPEPTAWMPLPPAHGQ